jgi:hypothetical protein
MAGLDAVGGSHGSKARRRCRGVSSEMGRKKRAGYRAFAGSTSP